jgi:hypothetical protein
MRYEKEFYTVTGLDSDNQKCSCKEFRTIIIYIIFARKKLNKTIFENLMVPTRYRLDFSNNITFLNSNSRSRNSISIPNINTIDKEQFENKTQPLTTKDK